MRPELSSPTGRHSTDADPRRQAYGVPDQGWSRIGVYNVPVADISAPATKDVVDKRQAKSSECSGCGRSAIRMRGSMTRSPRKSTESRLRRGRSSSGAASPRRVRRPFAWRQGSGRVVRRGGWRRPRLPWSSSAAMRNGARGLWIRWSGRADAARGPSGAAEREADIRLLTAPAAGRDVVVCRWKLGSDTRLGSLTLRARSRR